MPAFDELNKKINNRIQEISIKIHKKKYTKKEYEEIAELVYPKLKYHIWKFCKNDLDTEEALHFTLVKIFNNIEKYNPESGRFTTWAFTIARNETLYYLDRKYKDIPKYIEISALYEDSKYNDQLSADQISSNHNEVTMIITIIIPIIIVIIIK